MGTKLVVLLGLFLAVALLISCEVASASTTDAVDLSKEAAVTNPDQRGFGGIIRPRPGAGGGGPIIRPRPGVGGGVPNIRPGPGEDPHVPHLPLPGHNDPSCNCCGIPDCQCCPPRQKPEVEAHN